MKLLIVEDQAKTGQYLRQGLNDNVSLGESDAHLSTIFAPAAGG